MALNGFDNKSQFFNVISSFMFLFTLNLNGFKQNMYIFVADRGYTPPPFVDMSSSNMFLFLSLIDAFLLPTKRVTAV